MTSQIDYIIAAGIFLAAFLFITAFISSYSSSSLESLQTAGLRAKALAILGSVERPEGGVKITEIGLGTDAFAFQIKVENPGSAKNESSSFRLSEVGYSNADRNSVAIRDGDTQLPYTLSGDVYTFNAEIPPGGKTLTVWFDDDSGFAPKSSAIPILEDLLPHRLLQVESARIVQFRHLQSLSDRPYETLREDFDFRLRLVSAGGLEYFRYGSTPPPSNVIALQRPVVFQTSGADYVKGYMIAEVW